VSPSPHEVSRLNLSFVTKKKKRNNNISFEQELIFEKTKRIKIKACK
jgi:hypothetical protein